MAALLDEFQERVSEVDVYLGFLRFSDEAGGKLVSPNGGEYEFEEELRKILKANAYLILYNLIEATIRSAIQSIYDRLESEQIGFDDLREELRSTIFGGLKGKNPDNLSKEIRRITTDIIKSSFNSDRICDGNIDALRIRDLARKYGFSSKTSGRIARGGEGLLAIKSNRNDLAHGSKSFMECGRGTASKDIIDLRDHTVNYLSQILSNIQEYIETRSYLTNNIASVG